MEEKPSYDSGTVTTLMATNKHKNLLRPRGPIPCILVSCVLENLQMNSWDDLELHELRRQDMMEGGIISLCTKPVLQHEYKNDWREKSPEDKWQEFLSWSSHSVLQKKTSWSQGQADENRFSGSTKWNIHQHRQLKKAMRNGWKLLGSWKTKTFV